jgi:hypothetical protein
LCDDDLYAWLKEKQPIMLMIILASIEHDRSLHGLDNACPCPNSPQLREWIGRHRKILLIPAAEG